MADINPVAQDGHLNRPGYVWETITNADTPTAARIEGGKYTCTAQGAFDSATIEFQYSKDDTTYHSLDSTNMLFNADGSYNFEIGRGYIKPVIAGSGGGSQDIDAFITPLPSEPA